MEIVVRTAMPSDAEALLNIYAPYVEGTAITFEYEVPSLMEFRSRIESTLNKYPYLVAESEEGILGYAYTGPFKTRAAYSWAVETSIYIAMGRHGQGLGRKLYEALEEISKKQGILNMNACITYADHEDQYLTHASPAFHEHLGYTLVGRFHKCGYKFGRWYDMIWMEKSLGEHTVPPREFIPFPLL